MTTPEHFRRRQRLELLLVGLLALALGGAWLYFRERTSDVVDCVVQYQEQQSETSQIRAGIVERESKATRKVITGARRVETRREFDGLFDRYERRLHRIDRARDRHPVTTFSIETCTNGETFDFITELVP